MSENLKQIFENYDNADPVSARLENKHLLMLAQQKASQKEASGEENSNTKKSGIVSIVKKIQSSINALLPDGKKLDLDINFFAGNADSYSQTGARMGVAVLPKTESKYGNVAMNINLKRLSRLPALEVYSVIYKSLFGYVSKQKLIENPDKIKPALLDDKKQQNKQDKQEAKEVKDKARATAAIAEYLKKFLPKYFADKFEKFDHISELIASQIVEGLDEKDFTNILTNFFDLSKLDENAKKLVDKFLGIDFETARLDKVTSKAMLLFDSDKGVQSLSYLQQAEELLSINNQNLFKEALNSGNFIENSKEFCMAYAKSFLAAHNISEIEVTFNNEGELGTFNDTNPPSININTSKLSSISEFVQTISHELTHAVDSCANRVNGNFNREGGGILNSVDEDTSDCGLKNGTPEYAFLNELKRYCYFVDPSERNARLGELSALKFMEQMSDSDGMGRKGELFNSLSSSIQSYVKYQNKTIKHCEDLSPAKIESFRSQMNSFGKLPKKALSYMEERIDYLEGIVKSGLNLNVEAERNSIKVVEEILENKRKEQQQRALNSKQKLDD